MIRVERHGAERGQFAGLGEIVIDRPEKRNALTPDMMRTIASHAQALEADENVRAIVLRGEGSVFCAGFDLSLCREDHSAMAELLKELSAVIKILRRCSKPVVIAAHGAAIAGGCALLGGADMVITNRDAKLGYPVVRLGISPAVNAPTLRRAIGDRPMRRRLLDPALFDGNEARRIGLAALCVDTPEDVTPRAQIEAMKLGAKPPAAFAVTKAWINEVDGSMDDAEMDRALGASLALVGGEEERMLLSQMWARESGGS